MVVELGCAQEAGLSSLFSPSPPSSLRTGTHPSKHDTHLHPPPTVTRVRGHVADLSPFRRSERTTCIPSLFTRKLTHNPFSTPSPPLHITPASLPHHIRLPYLPTNTLRGDYSRYNMPPRKNNHFNPNEKGSHHTANPTDAPGGGGSAAAHAADEEYVSKADYILLDEELGTAKEERDAMTLERNILQADKDKWAEPLEAMKLERDKATSLLSAKDGMQSFMPDFVPVMDLLRKHKFKHEAGATNKLRVSRRNDTRELFLG